MTGAGVKLVRTGGEQASLGYTFFYSSNFFLLWLNIAKFTILTTFKVYSSVACATVTKRTPPELESASQAETTHSLFLSLNCNI